MGKKHPPALIPRQIPPAPAPRGALGVQARRARAATWQDVAADALLANAGADSKRFVEEEKRRLLFDIETSRARLADDAPRGPPTTGTRDGSERRLEIDSTRREEDDPRRERRRPRKRARDVAYWERHYAAKHGIPLDEDEKRFPFFEGAVSDEKDEKNAFAGRVGVNAFAVSSREGSSAAATATTTPDVEARAAAFDADREGRGVSFSLARRRVAGREPEGFFVAREKYGATERRGRGDGGDGGERYVSRVAFPRGGRGRSPPLRVARLGSQRHAPGLAGVLARG